MNIIVGPPVCLIFSFSIAFPILLGAWAIGRYPKDRFMVALGALAILIGFAVGIMNVIVISEYSFYYSGAFQRMLFVTAMMELLFVPLLIFEGAKVRGEMVNNENWRRSAKLLSASLAAILIITVVGGSMMPITKIKCQYGFDISISVDLTGSYYLYLPVPLSGGYGVYVVSEFVDDLRFVDGEGNISIIDTEYGPALNVSSNASATIRVEGGSAYESIDEVSMRNTSGYGYGDRFWVFSNRSFPGSIVVDVVAKDNCPCTYSLFRLSADIDVSGWGSHQGAFEVAVC
ncbi:MAG: hypothetical protein V3V91_07300 [Thermoplasmata archaeon]